MLLMLTQRLLLFLCGLLFLTAAVLGFQGWQGSMDATVIVEWSTASELDTAGFHLYRSENPDGSYSRITRNLIPASPDPLTGGSYSYLDSDVVVGQTYFYELEEIEINGSTSRFGPIEAKAEGDGKTELTLAVTFAGVGAMGAVMLISQRRLESLKRGTRAS